MSAPSVDVAGTRSSLEQIESELSLLFRRARELLKVTAADVHPELSLPGYATLAYLATEGSVRASALAEHFGVDKGTMSRQLAQLEKLGLVRRTQDPADGRAQVVAATALGTRRWADARSASRRRLRARVADWDERQLSAFATLLHDFNATLTDKT